MLARLLIAFAIVLFLIIAWVSQVHGYAIVLGKEIPLRAQANGQVLWVIEQGTKVKKGDRVIQLDVRDTELELKQAEAELDAARAELAFERRRLEEELAELRTRQEEIQVRVAQASEQVAMNNVQLELDDYLSDKADALFEHSLVSEIDRSKLNHAQRASEVSVETSSKVLDRRTAQLRRIDGVVKGHFNVMAQRERLGRARITTLERKVERYRRLVEKGTVRAPVDGVVSMRQVPSGGDAKLGDMIVSILDQSELSVAVYVPEAELGNVSLAVHEEVKVRFNSHPLRSVPARVVQRYARVSLDTESAAGSLETEVAAREGLVLASRVQTLDSCPFELRPGMTGTVQLGRRNLLWPIQAGATGLSKVLGL